MLCYVAMAMLSTNYICGSETQAPRTCVLRFALSAYFQFQLLVFWIAINLSIFVTCLG